MEKKVICGCLGPQKSVKDLSGSFQEKKKLTDEETIALRVTPKKPVATGAVRQFE